MKHPVPAWMFQAIEQFVLFSELFSIRSQSIPTDLQGLTSFLKCFLEISSDSHRLAYGFHLQSELAICSVEFIKVPARYFYNNVVNSRFEISCCCTCDRIF